jgi:3-hydroxyisobutyrate dehydrogenase-like beta-hydroxyacid dehydrogenase
MRNTPPVGVIGLGLLGTALAERLLDAGFQVVVYNRTRSKADSLIQLGARWSDNPLAECDRVVISLYTTEVVELVLKDLESELRPGHLLLDTTTGEPSQTETLGTRMYDRGVEYLETPIAASSEQTRRGEAVAIVGGTSEAFRAGRDLLNAIAAKSFHVGDWGAAAKIKLVNNLILGLHRVALAEGLAFAREIGIDPADALDVVKQGSAYSNAMDAKGKKMVERDFSTQAKLSQHLKDIRLILEEARLANLRLPFTALHRQTLERLEELGFGEEDNSAIIRAFEKESP